MNLRALLELMRVSNLPTVWSNVAAGYAIGLTFSYAYVYDVRTLDVGFFDSVSYMTTRLWVHLFLMLTGISLIYCGGMVLNDYWDRDLDAVERPTRPIPSGRIQAGTAGVVAVTMLTAGFLLAGGYWVSSLIDNSSGAAFILPHLSALSMLIACVVLYNRVHQKTVASVSLMGLCRSLAFLTPALLLAPFPRGRTTWFIFVFGPALCLLLYTLAISIIARREVEPDGPRKFGGPKTVMNMIAAMPLLDAAWLVVMGLWPASLVCVGCAVLTKLGHRKVAGS